jgi:Leucine Rich Repeat (LRR) protein
MRIIPALVAALLGCGRAQAQQPSGQLSPIERQVLVELFASTGGARWTNHEGWSTSMPVCDWHGVVCDFIDGDANRPFVAGLSLALNNLEGRLPASLAKLPRLRSLDVTGNRLSGAIPEPLLRRWDQHRLELSGDGNAFSDMIVRASIAYAASGVLCAEHDDLRFHLDLDAGTGRAVLQSVRCADSQSRQTYCLVREGTTGSFARLSRELGRLGFARFASSYDDPLMTVTHGLSLTTAAMWGDGSRQSVETYNRQGPRQVWVAQELFLALLAEASWDRETRRPTCDFEK